MSDLYVVFLIGLFGSAHCIGMCGGFVLVLSQRNAGSRQLHLHQILYAVGKTITYTVLGALVGGVGAAFSMFVSEFQNILSIVLGVVLILIGLGIMGVLGRLPVVGGMAGKGMIARAVGLFLKKNSRHGTLGLGLVNGLLPCGLVYGVLVQAAATGTVLYGALTMAVFGFSTIPALYILGMTGLLMRPIWRSRLNMVSGLLVILLGLITIVRGTPLMRIIMGYGDNHQHEMVEHPPEY